MQKINEWSWELKEGKIIKTLGRPFQKNEGDRTKSDEKVNRVKKVESNHLNLKRR